MSAVVRILSSRDSSFTRRIHQPRASQLEGVEVVVAVAIQNVQAGTDEADEPRWRLLPESGYRAISGIVGPGPDRRHSRDRRGELFALVIAEVRLSTDTASLMRVLPKRGSMNSPLHWQGGPPPWCGPPTPSRIWSEEELDG
jgi:hypothetical protein